MIVSKKITVPIKNLLNALKDQLSKEPDVMLAYIFGSYSSGNVTPLSDFDIAVLLDKKLSKKLLLERERQLFSAISKILHTDEVDLIILDTAPIGLQFSIVKTGKLIFCRDDSKRTDFVENVTRNYLNTMPIRQEILFHLNERLGI